MIRIHFVEPNDCVLWKRWRDDCVRVTQDLIKYQEQDGTVVEVAPALYGRTSIKQRYYYQAKGERFAPFFGKCVYCEVAKGILHVEHFRPKKAPTDADGHPITRLSKDGDWVVHPGYYWLTYDWANLLLACDDCNSLWKKNQFPLADEATRAWSSTDDTAAEAALLINPLHEDPSEDLAVDVNTGLFTYLSERGQRTIEIFGLNERDLPEERRSVVRTIQYHFLKAMDQTCTAQEKQDARDYLHASRQGHYKFTLTARTAIDGYLKDIDSLKSLDSS